MNDFNTESYSVSKPAYSQRGASMNVYFKDSSYMNMEVNMTWCKRQDIVEIEKIKADYYDHEGTVLSTVGIDLNDMVIKICEHFNTFGSVENEMSQAYHDDHA